ncbi:MAG: hypothetical protein S4CHLAM107_10390 [Chlamydiia bacterium]|nr:hypothetical protein [Chlamydiia bacterium]
MVVCVAGIGGSGFAVAAGTMPLVKDVTIDDTALPAFGKSLPRLLPLSFISVFTLETKLKNLAAAVVPVAAFAKVPMSLITAKSSAPVKDASRAVQSVSISSIGRFCVPRPLSDSIEIDLNTVSA